MMSQSTIDPHVADRPAGKPHSVMHQLRRLLMPIASLKITVTLFAMSMVLVFVGTVAQMDESNWVVVNKYFRSFYAWIPFQLFVRLGQVFFGVSKDASVPGGIPFPGGWTLGAALLVNLLAAHTVRFKTTWRRSGVLILHAGIIALILGELITGVCSIESRMTLAEGESVNYLDNARTGLGAPLVELALTDVSDPTADTVAVVPGSVLKAGGVIRDAGLPVDVEVLEYFANSALVKARGPAKREVRVSTAGLRFTVVPRSEAAGTDVEQMEDAITARVRLRRTGADDEVGTFLVSLWFDMNFTHRVPVYRFPPQTFKLDGRTYTVELRNRREYLPYSLRLLEFRHDRFVGTDTPRNFSSLVRVDDPDRHESREVLIYMNHPLRRFAHGGPLITWLFNGETFYQSSYLPPEAGVSGTVLQVVHNPGWFMPYASCLLVSVGMMTHFGIHLFGFLRRRAAV
jgi:hypothetical protein